MAETKTARGLKGVTVGESRVGKVDGANGRLYYRGYSIQDLARNASFGEVAFLLWHGRLPTTDELKAIRKEFAAEYSIPDYLVNIIRSLPTTTHPMDVIRTAISALAGNDPKTENNKPEETLRKAVAVTAKTGTIIATYDRIRRGLDPVPADPNLPLAANFLQMMHGKPPSKELAKAMDVMLVLHADHGFNASTFSARVTVSTEADLYAGVTSAIGTLKGPLHGGANQRVREMLEKIADPANVEAWVTSELGHGNRIMGFGHRVYKVMDPRAAILREHAETLARESGNEKWFEMTRRLEETMKGYKGGKLAPNVDLYSPSCFEALGIDVDLYTTMFTMGRMPGWTAHILEQLGDNQLIRPLAEYKGEKDLPWVPIEQR